jgi:four helix bundle protein
MGKVERFEDLRCWQEARTLTQSVYTLCSADPLRSDFRLRNQLTGAAVSVMSNIAEGFARYHRREFTRFLDIAQSSAVEVKSLLYVALDQEYAPPDQISILQKQCDRTKALILGLIRYIKKQSELSARDGKIPYRTNAKTQTIGGSEATKRTGVLNLPDDFIYPL